MKAVKVIKAGTIIGSLCLATAGGIQSGYAYFSGTSEIKINQLSIARGEQDQDGALIIVEPEWDAGKEADENYAMDMQPGESVVKDPRVERLSLLGICGSVDSGRNRYIRENR